MPTLEITQLRLKGIAVDDPVLLENLSDVRTKLETHSRFYSCIEDPELIYILGIWPTLTAHLDFLASPARGKVLGPQEDILQFCWTAHLELDSMSSLPLDAPVLAIERLSFGGDPQDPLEHYPAKHAYELSDNHPFKVKHGWRCDPTVGSHELFIFSGWKDVQSHVTFEESRQGDSDFAHVKGQCEHILIHHGRDLERDRK
ncbi:hypothetical protein NX059_009177 [Plenodomus lindquistii]|nr:hypothetical protein NX059_009177 [Plenodomus lindquistii]